jgi:hypothetical protein
VAFSVRKGHGALVALLQYPRAQGAGVLEEKDRRSLLPFCSDQENGSGGFRLSAFSPPASRPVTGYAEKSL